MFKVDPGKAAIYGLYDPRDGELRYVGMSVQPEIRFNQHLNDGRGSTHKLRWLAKLARLGLKPEIKVLDIVDVDEAPTREIEIIALMRDRGVRLTNATVGGEGVVLTLEILAKRNASIKIAQNRPEVRARKSRAAIAAGCTPPRLPGASNPLAKLNDEAVADIRRRLKRGESLEFVCSLYPETSKQSIQMAARGKTWVHVPESPYTPKPRKTTPESRARMKEIFKAGKSQSEIATYFNIDQSHVSRIVRDKTRRKLKVR